MVTFTTFFAVNKILENKLHQWFYFLARKRRFQRLNLFVFIFPNCSQNILNSDNS